MDFVTWPIVGLIFGLVAIFAFRQPLSRFLDRTRRITKSGIEADPRPQDSKTDVKPSVAEELQRLFDNALLVQRETLIRTELERFAFKDMNERERFLVRLLAAGSIIQAFERTYSLIWGSQLEALQFLNSVGPDGGQTALLQPWYDQAAARHSEAYANYTFDQWLGFLESQQLLLRKEMAILITLEGREFLKYLVHQGYSLYKAG